MLPLARVPGVTPRPLIAALAIALAAIASGCATFTDSNNVARVGDETLSNDELREIVSAITGTPIGETTDGVNGINFGTVTTVKLRRTRRLGSPSRLRGDGTTQFRMETGNVKATRP